MNDINDIFCFWTGNNEMSSNRRECLKQLVEKSECSVTLVTPENLSKYILPNEPLHPAFNYLSETHKADYLRTYFMHFYGGAYSDIKRTTGSWRQAIDLLRNDENIWAVGYKEIRGGVAYQPYEDKWNDLIGNCAYIFKPRTPLTYAWHEEMISLLDSKLNDLIKYPAKNPQDSKEKYKDGIGYPLEWNEMLGRIFHKWVYKYRDHVDQSLPISIFSNYR
jgi:hypothetical protein